MRTVILSVLVVSVLAGDNVLAQVRGGAGAVPKLLRVSEELTGGLGRMAVALDRNEKIDMGGWKTVEDGVRQLQARIRELRENVAAALAEANRLTTGTERVDAQIDRIAGELEQLAAAALRADPFADSNEREANLWRTWASVALDFKVKYKAALSELEAGSGDLRRADDTLLRLSRGSELVLEVASLGTAVDSVRSLGDLVAEINKIVDAFARIGTQARKLVTTIGVRGSSPPASADALATVEFREWHEVGTGRTFVGRFRGLRDRDTAIFDVRGRAGAVPLAVDRLCPRDRSEIDRATALGQLALK